MECGFRQMNCLQLCILSFLMFKNIEKVCWQPVDKLIIKFQISWK